MRRAGARGAHSCSRIYSGGGAIAHRAIVPYDAGAMADKGHNGLARAEAGVTIDAGRPPARATARPGALSAAAERCGRGRPLTQTGLLDHAR
jgi:hypothetical protein